VAVAVVDEVLSPEALQRVRDILQESTVWSVSGCFCLPRNLPRNSLLQGCDEGAGMRNRFETKMPERFGGYVGAYLDDGLHQRLLLALSQELRTSLPRILGTHPLR
jgi:hypothetical protein